MIAVQELAAVINVRSAHRASSREGDRTGAPADTRIAGAGILTTCQTNHPAVLVVNPVARRDGRPEVEEIRIRPDR